MKARCPSSVNLRQVDFNLECYANYQSLMEHATRLNCVPSRERAVSAEYVASRHRSSVKIFRTVSAVKGIA